MIERAFDQLDLISLDLVVKVDAVVIEAYLFTAAIGRKLCLQSFNLAGQSLGKQRQLPHTLFELGGVVSIRVVYVLQ